MCEGGEAGHLCTRLYFELFHDHRYVEVALVSHQVFPLQERCKEGLQVRSSGNEGWGQKDEVEKIKRQIKSIWEKAREAVVACSLSEPTT